MEGKTREAATIITAQYPLALYVLCVYHQLNLAVIKLAEVTSVRNVMGTCKKLHDFFYAHSKCQQQQESSMLRDNVDDHHRDWFRDVEKMCREDETEPSIHRQCSKQYNHANTPVQTACEYYKCFLTIPSLDHVLSQLNSRFANHAIQRLCLVPEALAFLTPDEAQEKLTSLINLHKNNLPSLGSMKSEAHCW